MPRTRIDAHPEARREVLEEFARLEEARPGWGRKLRVAYERKLEQIRHVSRSGTDVDLPGGYDVQRFVIRKFGFSMIVLTRGDRLTILAFAAKGRRPGYWRDRLEQ